MALDAGREPKANLRFVLTDVRGSARRIYEIIYCRRGDAENRLKELKAGLRMDRTSCHRFEANQLRVLLAAAAYALLQELRGQARETRFARAQVERLRDFLLKLGARVKSTVRRLMVYLSQAVPTRAEWLVIARNLGALAPP